MPSFTRRSLLATGLVAATLPVVARAQSTSRPRWAMPPEWEPRVVTLTSSYSAGQIHVVPAEFALYLTLGGQAALRYMVGIGKGDLYEAGSFHIGAKKEWPSWKPTPEMVERNPAAYKKWSEGIGMPGGPTNPLGARALYLFAPNQGDTMLRIHGTPEPWTIGSAVSNGCVRLVNAHIEELYNQVTLGSPVVLHAKGNGAAV